MRRLILLAALLSLVAVQASSQQRSRAKAVPKDEVLFDDLSYSLLDGLVGWRLAVRGNLQPDGRQKLTYYDPERITGSRGIKQAWLKTESLTTNGLEFYWIDLNEFDCGRGRFRVLEAHEYSGESVLTESARPAKPQWVRVIPDSVGEDLFGVICLKQKDQMRLDMEEAARLFRLGRQAEKKQRLVAAIRWYEDALELQPGNPDIEAALRRVRSRRVLHRRVPAIQSLAAPVFSRRST